MSHTHLGLIILAYLVCLCTTPVEETETSTGTQKPTEAVAALGYHPDAKPQHTVVDSLGEKETDDGGLGYDDSDERPRRDDLSIRTPFFDPPAEAEANRAEVPP